MATRHFFRLSDKKIIRVIKKIYIYYKRNKKQKGWQVEWYNNTMKIELGLPKFLYDNRDWNLNDQWWFKIMKKIKVKIKVICRTIKKWLLLNLQYIPRWNYTYVKPWIYFSSTNKFIINYSSKFFQSKMIFFTF